MPSADTIFYQNGLFSLSSCSRSASHAFENWIWCQMVFLRNYQRTFETLYDTRFLFSNVSITLLPGLDLDCARSEKVTTKLRDGAAFKVEGVVFWSDFSWYYWPLVWDTWKGSAHSDEQLFGLMSHSRAFCMVSSFPSFIHCYIWNFTASQENCWPWINLISLYIILLLLRNWRCHPFFLSFFFAVFSFFSARVFLQYLFSFIKSEQSDFANTILFHGFLRSRFVSFMFCTLKSEFGVNWFFLKIVYEVSETSCETKNLTPKVWIREEDIWFNWRPSTLIVHFCSDFEQSHWSFELLKTQRTNFSSVSVYDYETTLTKIAFLIKSEKAQRPGVQESILGQNVAYWLTL